MCSFFTRIYRPQSKDPQDENVGSRFTALKIFFKSLLGMTPPMSEKSYSLVLNRLRNEILLIKEMNYMYKAVLS